MAGDVVGRGSHNRRRLTQQSAGEQCKDTELLETLPSGALHCEQFLFDLEQRCHSARKRNRNLSNLGTTWNIAGGFDANLRDLDLGVLLL